MVLPDKTTTPAAHAFRFADFELDLAAYRLSRQGESVALERRPFNLLVLLVTRHGQIITREEIVSALWPDNVIIDFDAGVNTLIRKIRQALGDSSGEPAFVETVPARGYRFIAPVERLTPLEPQQAAGTRMAEQRPHRRNLTRLAILATLAAALVLIGWLVWLRDPKAMSIVVLPMEDRSGAIELGYLAAGLTEEVSAALTRIEPDRLRVIGGVSATALSQTAPPLSEAGRKLGIDWVVRTSLQATDTRLRVNASLIRADDDRQIWAAAFDRELVDMLGLQRELSIAIAEQVRLRLSPDVAAAVARRQTRNPQAYEHYLKGRFLWGQLTPAANREARAYYERAVREDPTYALAWAGIAQALAIAPMTTDTQPANVSSAARDAARRAVRYGPDLAEAHYALGYVNLFLDWDAPAAEVAARHAVRLDPNNALAHLFLGVVLSHQGHHVEALVMMRRARELDPLFSHTFALSSMVARQSGDYPAARTFAQQAIAIGPDAWVGYLHLGYAHLALGAGEAALEAFSTAQRLSGGNSHAVASVAFVQARLGRVEEARAILYELERQASERYVPPYATAIIQAGLGDNEAAFDWLDRAVAVRDVQALGMHTDLRLAAVRDDPRFEQLLARCGCAPR